jgi:hypothetical protein
MAVGVPSPHLLHLRPQQVVDDRRTAVPVAQDAVVRGITPGTSSCMRSGHDHGCAMNLRLHRWSLAIIAVSVEIAAFGVWRVWLRRRDR